MSTHDERLGVLTKQLQNDRALKACGSRLIAMALGDAPGLTRKTAVTAAGPSDLPFVADPDAAPLVSGVQRRSVAGRLLTLGAHPAPPGQLLPVADDDPTPQWVAEGFPIPLARISSTTTTAPIANYSLLLAFLRDLFINGDDRARQYALGISTRALVKADNAMFLGTTAASAANPAGLLWNRPAVGAGSPSELTDDVSSLVAACVDGAPTAPVFVLSPRAAIFLNASNIQAFRDVGLSGGTIAGAPALIAPEAGSNLILIDAAEIAIADGGLEVFPSEAAAVQMSDSPTTGAASMVSSFQTGALFLKFDRFLSWALLRPDACQFLELPIGGSPS